MRAATASDQPAIDAFLRARLRTSMFLLSNLRRFGATGGPWARAMRVWLAGQDRIEGLVALSTDGTILPQWPGGDWRTVPGCLSGEEVTGLIGETSQVAAIRAALSLQGAATTLDEDETLFELALNDLRLPEDTGDRLVALDDWRDLATDWSDAYHREALGTPADKSAEAAREDIADAIAGATHRLLLHDGRPVAMTGFNASLPEAVQVGGVYTPPALRGRGHARRAVALHLVEARDRGVPHAILFATNPAAIRVYESLGFRASGGFSLVLLAQPARLP